jgi:hypothetical protein
VPVHSPVRLGIRRRCRNAAHTAAVVGAGGMRAGAGADGGGTAARAGAGIDSGMGGILVDLDLGRQHTVLGADAGGGAAAKDVFVGGVALGAAVDPR